MGLVIVLVVGATLGWFVSVWTQTNMRQTVAMDIASGAFGSAIVAAAFAQHSLIEGLAAQTLMLSIGGAILSIGMARFFQRQIVG